MDTIYSYRIIVKVDQPNPDFNLDLYELDGEVLTDAIHQRIESFMSTNSNRATSVNTVETKYIGDDKLEDIVYFFEENLFPPDQDLTALDEIDTVVENAIKAANPTKEGLPKPPIYIWTGSVDVNPYGGNGRKIIYTIKKQPTVPDSYVPDTTAYKRRGLVKIQGEEQYREVGQIIGKDLVGNPTTVASNNQTHVSASETDEQVENSIAVSIWYFKNKTTQNFDTFENKSSIPSTNYKNEYQRIKSIIG
jgi:hypothetical protein